MRRALLRATPWLTGKLRGKAWKQVYAGSLVALLRLIASAAPPSDQTPPPSKRELRERKLLGLTPREIELRERERIANAPFVAAFRAGLPRAEQVSRRALAARRLGGAGPNGAATFTQKRPVRLGGPAGRRG